MKIQCTDSKTFELMNEPEMTGQLIYKHLFSFEATILTGAKTYHVKPYGVFSTNIGVFENEQEVASLKMNWKGQIVITRPGEKVYVLKAKGAFLNHYVLEDEQQNQCLLLKPDFNWSKFSYNYDVSQVNDIADNTLLVLLSIYSANYFIAAMSASV